MRILIFSANDRPAALFRMLVLFSVGEASGRRSPAFRFGRARVVFADVVRLVRNCEPPWRASLPRERRRSGGGTVGFRPGRIEDVGPADASDLGFRSGSIIMPAHHSVKKT